MARRSGRAALKLETVESFLAHLGQAEPIGGIGRVVDHHSLARGQDRVGHASIGM
jgi:hypothetical protein